ncbi:MAG: type II toxin-antitoxin system RelE/ParE family toxin [Planctomycetaceae bacterium]
MKLPLQIRPQAERDLTEARDWYSQQAPGLEVSFLSEVDVVFDRIQQNPHLYAAEHRSVRRASLGRFPYIVYYRIDASSIEIIAVLHGSRHPHHWQSRS